MRNSDLVDEGSLPIFSDRSPALCLQIHAQHGCARAATMHLPHGQVELPTFMPVGTKGSIKGLASCQLDREELALGIVLGNTYHLALQPGSGVLAEVGGLHTFMNWPRNLLTDSGGFQMVSLLELADISEEGVRFKSPVDGTTMLLRPEDSIHHQNNIGSDIMMQLDDVVSSVTEDHARFKEACDRTLRWLDRCVVANTNPTKQNLFGIVQGGLDTSSGGLRDASLGGMIARDLPGYAIGGLAGGEAKGPFWRVVHQCVQRLPAGKPRYLMGVGYPLDLVVCVALGVDMFDCVYPTRTARFGVALVDAGTLKLKSRAMANDGRPIDITRRCNCLACASYSRGTLHAMLKTSTAAPVACQLLTIHNIAYMLDLTRRMRTAVMSGSYGAFVRSFLVEHFAVDDAEAATKTRDDECATIPSIESFSPANHRVPSWVVGALAASGCDWGGL